MRFIIVLTLSITSLFAYAQFVTGNADTKPSPGTIKQQSNPKPMLGLPPLIIPVDNPQTQAKIELGNKLFHDKRFSIDGTVSCSNCHDDNKAFTDNLPVSLGNNGKFGTRNAPTVINAAYNKVQFWDGREPDLESQSKQPLINPVEHGLSDYKPLLTIVQTDPEYVTAFKSVFNINEKAITMDYVAKAIASFERTVLSGNSAFDRYYFKGDKTALSEAQMRGLQVFLGQGRCVSCHVIENDQALFTDSKFHNIGIGINQIQQDVPKLAEAFLAAKNKGANVDISVLSDKKSSELGRFAVTDVLSEVGAFKTPTLRDIELTAPYMHDGSLKNLNDVVKHYNNGGVTKVGDPVNPYLSGGIRPLKLDNNQIDDLVAFLKALTGSKAANLAAKEN
ncbi:MAG: cytochrome c peroxidase [Methyloglobulus sp.]|nr:cytochrome-c peroxidase [Methyloglobulus sp.]